MKKTLLLLLLPFLGISQTQIGPTIIGENINDQFGKSVSLNSDGNVIAIGADFNDGNGNNSGHVRVYENIGGLWTQIGSDIDGENIGGSSGFSVSLNSTGNIVAIGAYVNNGNGESSGHVRVLENIGGIWTQIGLDIDGESMGDWSGFSVNLNSTGNIVAIGAVANFDSIGYVRVYENIGGIWTQIGSDIDGEDRGNWSGFSVSLNSTGDIVAIGAPYNYDNGDLSGHVRVYKNISGCWTQIGSDIDGDIRDSSGYSVSLSSDGNIVAIGAPYSNGNGFRLGHVAIYENVSDTWLQVNSKIYGEADNDLSGYSVSLSGNGNIVLIGSVGNENSTGQVRIYRNISGSWTQIGSDITGNNTNDAFGGSVSLSANGSNLAIGAKQRDIFGNGNNNNGYVKIYNISALLSSDEFVLSNFDMFPNPAKNQFTIQLKQGLILNKVNIYNSLGQFLNSNQHNVIDTSKLSTGIYYVEILTNKGKATRKLVIE